MATATQTPNKTGFVRDFLQGNPQANAKAVNEAWSAGGMEGTINHATVSEVRKQMGLSGKQGVKSGEATKKPASKESKAAPATPKPTSKRRRKAKTVVQEEATAKAPEPASATLGKTGFVKEFLNDNPHGNPRAVNEAWAAAGMGGTISPTLVNKMRASLGLTGNLRGKTKRSKAKTTPSGKKLGRPRKETTAAVDGPPRGNRTTALEGLEAEIDRLLFKVMGIGDLTEIEDSLRRARRLLYGALTA